MKLPRNVITDCYQIVLIKSEYGYGGQVKYVPATRRQLERAFKRHIRDLPIKYDQTYRSYRMTLRTDDTREKREVSHRANAAKVKKCLCCGKVQRSSEFDYLYIRGKGKYKTINTCKKCNSAPIGDVKIDDSRPIENMRDYYYRMALNSVPNEKSLEA